MRKGKCASGKCASGLIIGALTAAALGASVVAACAQPSKTESSAAVTGIWQGKSTARCGPTSERTRCGAVAFYALLHDHSHRLWMLCVFFLGPTGNAPDRTVSQNCCYEAGTITVGGSDGVAAGCSEVGCSKACCGVGTGAVEVD